jgi:hypothetical protein
MYVIVLGLPAAYRLLNDAVYTSKQLHHAYHRGDKPGVSLDESCIISVREASSGSKAPAACNCF